MYTTSRRWMLASGFALVSIGSAQAQISLPIAPTLTLALAPVTALTIAPNIAPTINLAPVLSIAPTGTLTPSITGSSLLGLPAGALLLPLAN